MTTVKTGLEAFIESPPAGLRGQRLGLLCNPASVDRHFVHARQLISDRFPGQLSALYSPQHGLYAEKQDNMIESADRRDPLTGLPVFSLYGATRIPTHEMLTPIDILLVDLQDVGTRVYTFVYTLSYCMEAARQYQKKVIVLDRPNPIGGLAVEGNLLAPAWSSFVGRYALPMRHGLTIGELAVWFNRVEGIGCDLEVVDLRGWRRSMQFEDTGLPWVPPSPNLPTPAAARVYPGQVIWEGTNISEGRGTTLPFEIVGAPFWEPERIAAAVDPASLAGVFLRPLEFEPTANKWAGQRCRGFQLHVTDSQTYRPLRLSLNLYQAVYQAYPGRFAYKAPPYEYEYERLPIDLILGNQTVRKAIESGTPIARIASGWEASLTAFSARAKTLHRYPV